MATSPPTEKPSGIVARLKGWLAVILPEPIHWGTLPAPVFGMFLMGVLMRLGFPPLEWTLLPYLSLIYFAWYFAKLRYYITLKCGFWLGFWFGFGYFYSSCFWLNTLTQFNPFVPIGIILLGATMALWIGALGVGMAFIARRAPRWLPLFFACAWTLHEWSRTQTGLAFPFFQLGHIFWDGGHFLTPVFGSLGYTFFMVLSAALVSQLLLRWWLWPPYYGRAAGFIWTVQAVICISLFPASFFSYPRPPVSSYKGEGKLSLELMQPNIEQWRKMATQDPGATREERGKMARQIVDESLIRTVALGGEPDVDLIVFPEATFPGMPMQLDPSLSRAVSDLAKRRGSSVLVGGEYLVETDPPSQYYDAFNASYLVNPNSAPDMSDWGLYLKRQLVPFGEYVPILGVIPGIQDYIFGIGTFQAGKGAQILDGPWDSNLGLLICFESSIPALARENVKEGADILVVMTNDAWFGRSVGLHYHRLHGAFRAAETGRPLVQAANTGYTCAFDARGRLIAEMTPHIRGSLKVDARLWHHDEVWRETAYLRYGDCWLWLLAGFLALIVGAAIWSPYGLPETDDLNGPDQAGREKPENS